MHGHGGHQFLDEGVASPAVTIVLVLTISPARAGSRASGYERFPRYPPLGERDALGDGPASRDCGAQHDNRLVVVFHNHFSALPNPFQNSLDVPGQAVGQDGILRGGWQPPLRADCQSAAG